MGVEIQIRSNGGLEEESIRRGTWERWRQVGLRLEYDLEGGGGQRGNKPAWRVDKELVGGRCLDLES